VLLVISTIEQSGECGPATTTIPREPALPQ
jgi:hypothetical protein